MSEMSDKILFMIKLDLKTLLQGVESLKVVDCVCGGKELKNK